MISTKYSRNKIMAIAGYTSFVLFVLLIITKSLLPDAGGGLSDPLIFEYLYLLGMGICFSILSIGYSYYSWTLSAKEFSEWFAVQNNNFENWLVRTDSFPSDTTLLSSSRFAGPVGGLMGVTITVFMLVAVFH